MAIDVEKIRNIAVIAHGGAGKTSLVEAMLYKSKAVDRMGTVEDGNTVTDFEAEEIERRNSLSSAPAYCDWDGHRLNIIDTPGYINFLEDAKCSMSAVDGAVLLISGVSGIKAETGKLWQYAEDYSLPRIVYVNKMDKDNADFKSAVDSLENAYGTSAVPLYVPMGKDGVIDLIKMKAFRDGKVAEIPDDVREDAEDQRKNMIEKVAETDDELLEKYLEGNDPTEDELNRVIRTGTLAGSFVPVVCGSAVDALGVQELLDAVVHCLPSPVDMAAKVPVKGKSPKSGEEVTREPDPAAPLAVRVFKTIADPFAGKLTLFRVYSGTLRSDSSIYNSVRDTKEKIGNMFYLLGKKQVPVKEVGPGEIAAVAKLKEAQTGDTLTTPDNPVILEPVRFPDPMISYAIEPRSRGDEEKVSTGLQRLLEEDPTLRFHRDAETKEMILGGMGQMHLEVTLQKLKRKFGTEVIMKSPKIPYRETIRAAANAQGKYKKQSGGRGQYGDCWIKIEPLPGGGFEFVNQIVGGAIPRSYIPAVEKGIVEKMKEGLIAGYPVIDLKATLYDGSYHNVDSSEMAFKIAGSIALQKAAPKAKAVLLEPIVKIEVNTPDEFLGNVIGDLNSKRGKVQGVEAMPNGDQKIVALIPMAEMLTYANQLNSLTSGQGMYTMEASHYEEVPAHIAQKIIAEKDTAKEKE